MLLYLIDSAVVRGNSKLGIIGKFGLEGHANARYMIEFLFQLGKEKNIKQDVLSILQKMKLFLWSISLNRPIFKAMKHLRSFCSKILLFPFINGKEHS